MGPVRNFVCVDLVQDYDRWALAPSSNATVLKPAVRHVTERNNESSKRPPNEDDAMPAPPDASPDGAFVEANDSKTKNAMVGKTIRIADTVSTSFVCSDMR